ncbi:hypothetical protein CMO83_02475 [Candidatus Woesearchaeota archaeon]|jgi:hypothetical protein|nr:hypothetical protein [Candidatus Woesearchaeota archaeon]MDP6648275.1 hypothetical protein [Candidatus Woesearchaeota archaeon]|tara:strand:- start:30835 stop:31164 length:330 start_codon:yes stop_codon:yes gene_type:complete
MATYPDSAYEPVMDYYRGIPEGPLKERANKVIGRFKQFPEGDAPPDEMLSALKSITSEGGLETATNAAHAEMAHKTPSSAGFSLPILTPQQSAVGLAIIGLLMGIPYII